MCCIIRELAVYFYFILLWFLSCHWAGVELLLLLQCVMLLFSHGFIWFRLILLKYSVILSRLSKEIGVILFIRCCCCCRCCFHDPNQTSVFTYFQYISCTRYFVHPLFSWWQSRRRRYKIQIDIFQFWAVKCFCFTPCNLYMMSWLFAFLFQLSFSPSLFWNK